MEFVAILGDRGSGKTNLLTALLKYERDSFKRRIVANYTLRFPYTRRTFEQVCAIPPELQGSAIGLDELGLGADSYKFWSKAAEKMAELIFELRKLHAKAFYTVQRFGLITVRLREQTDGYIMMDDPDRDVMWKDDPNGNRVYVADHREVCQGVFDARFFDRDRRFVKHRKFDGRPYWDLYDTDELIRKVGSNK